MYVRTVVAVLNTWMLISIKGQASLPEACPVCLHEPVKADDCRPNKALRTTIKVFLKKKIIERETAEKKRIAVEKAASGPSISVVPSSHETGDHQTSQTPNIAAPDEVPSATSGVAQDFREESQAAAEPKAVPTSDNPEGIPAEAQKDIPQQSIEVSLQYVPNLVNSCLIFGNSLLVPRICAEHLLRRLVM